MNEGGYFPETEVDFSSDEKEKLVYLSLEEDSANIFDEEDLLVMAKNSLQMVSQSEEALEEIPEETSEVKKARFLKEFDWLENDDNDDEIIALYHQGLLSEEDIKRIMSLLPKDISKIEFSKTSVLLVFMQGDYGKDLFNNFQFSVLENLKNISFGTKYLLQRLVRSGFKEKVLALLPDISSLTIFDFNENSVSLFNTISIENNDFKEKIVRKAKSLVPEEIDLAELSSNLIDLLKFLLKVDSSFEENLKSKFLAPFELSSINGSRFYFIRDLLDDDFDSETLASSLDLEKLSKSDIDESAVTLLEQMFLPNSEFKEKLIKKLSGFVPEVVDFAKLDTSLVAVLKLLISIDDDFKEKFVSRFDNLLSISEEGTPLLSYLLKNDFEGELVELLPDSLDGFEKNDRLFFLLYILVDGFYIKGEDALLDILKNSKNIFREKESSSFLLKLAKKGLDLELIEINILPELISNEDCALHIDFLLRLIEKDFGDHIVKALGSLSLKNIGSDKAMILFHLVEKGYGKEIMDRLGGSFELDDFFYSYNRFRPQDIYQARFLELLASEGFKPQLLELFSEKLEGYGELVRDPISFDELEVNAKVGPHLHEIIDKFPILPGSIEELRGGWVRGKIKKEKREDKHGNTIEEGEVFIYLKIDNDSFKVVFRNKNIEEQHLDTYKEAFDLIPEFVSNSVYPELQDKQEKNNFSPKVFSGEPRKLSTGANLPTFGFREVYAGVSLGTLSMKSLPNKVKESIENQKKYILMKLAINGISHGHPHHGNFNVRFLLEKNGKKQLFFDVNVALQHAIKNKMNFTPIVTLRDWDAATS